MEGFSPRHSSPNSRAIAINSLFFSRFLLSFCNLLGSGVIVAVVIAAVVVAVVIIFIAAAAAAVVVFVVVVTIRIPSILPRSFITVRLFLYTGVIALALFIALLLIFIRVRVVTVAVCFFGRF